jgi:hypothetical protein
LNVFLQIPQSWYYLLNMHGKYSERATIDEDILGRLAAEKERTSLGPNKILRYMRNRGLMPPGSKLKVAQVESWLSRLAASAPQADIDAIFAAYTEILPEHDLKTTPEANQLILICDDLVEELRDLLRARPNSCRRALLSSPETPKGLSAYRLQRLAAGQDRVILWQHLTYIRRISRR